MIGTSLSSVQRGACFKSVSVTYFSVLLMHAAASSTAADPTFRSGWVSVSTSQCFATLSCSAAASCRRVCFQGSSPVWHNLHRCPRQRLCRHHHTKEGKCLHAVATAGRAAAAAAYSSYLDVSFTPFSTFQQLQWLMHVWDGLQSHIQGTPQGRVGAACDLSVHTCRGVHAGLCSCSC
jgi:hypothetical protein